MNWEPMTEEAVFENGELLAVKSKFDFNWEKAGYQIQTDRFYYAKGFFYNREDITHFARITNPNEVKP